MATFRATEASKIIIVGEASVGKTSILDRWLHDSFSKNTAPTIGAGMSPVQIPVDGVNYSFHVWDTAGTPQFRSVVPMYCRKAVIALIVFDITNKASFDTISEWYHFVKENANPIFILIGNKIDQPELRQVQRFEAEQLADDLLKCQYVEVSALTSEGISLFSELVVEAAAQSIQSSNLLVSNSNNDSLKYQQSSDSNGGCC